MVAREHGDLGSLGREGAGDRRADRSAAAGHRNDVAGEPARRTLAEFGLFERPVLHRENIGLGNALIAPDRLGCADHGDVRLGDIGGHPRFAERSADAEEAEAWHEHDPRNGIQRFLRRHALCIVSREIVAVARNVARNLGADALSVVRHEHQWPRLDADHVVRRHGARLAVAANLGVARVGEDLLA